MEYYALAAQVGVQLESSREAVSEAVSSHPSSGFISARRRHIENMKKECIEDLEKVQQSR